jgi:hypothetical protein
MASYPLCKRFLACDAAGGEDVEKMAAEGKELNAVQKRKLKRKQKEKEKKAAEKKVGRGLRPAGPGCGISPVPVQF